MHRRDRRPRRPPWRSFSRRSPAAAIEFNSADSPGALAAFAAELQQRMRQPLLLAPGLAASAAVAVAAAAAADLVRLPAMLLALIFGLALNPIAAARPALSPGMVFCARAVLRFGIILLGARVTTGELAGLGLPTIALAVGALAATLAGGWLIGRLMGLRSDLAALSAGAVAICGASAALAIASVLPRRDDSDRNTTITIVGVAALSTLAMVLYPLIANALGLDHRAAGVFLGASIHDVAQVVGAGFMISPETGEIATVVKLMRVVCLAPAVAALGFLFRGQTDAKARAAPVPLFVLGFLAFVLIRSSGLISPPAAGMLAGASQWMLLISVAALGAKTSFREIFAAGLKPLAALTAQTVLIGAIALAGALLFI